jgi:serine/threonine-protein kinase 24/25/MST4
MRSDWNFDTVKSVAALGAFRGTANELLMPSGMIPEGDNEDIHSGIFNSMDTGAATKGSDPIPSSTLGADEAAPRSTVIIKPQALPGMEAQPQTAADDPPSGT